MAQFEHLRQIQQRLYAAQERHSGLASQDLPTRAATIVELRAAFTLFSDPALRPDFVAFAEHALGVQFIERVAAMRNAIESGRRDTRIVPQGTLEDTTADRIAEWGIEIAVKDADQQRRVLLEQIASGQQSGTLVGRETAVQELAQRDHEFAAQIVRLQDPIEQVALLQQTLLHEIERQRQAIDPSDETALTALLEQETALRQWADRETEEATPLPSLPHTFDLRSLAARFSQPITPPTTDTTQEAPVLATVSTAETNDDPTASFSSIPLPASAPKLEDVVYIDGVPYTHEEAALLQQWEAEWAAEQAVGQQGQPTPNGDTTPQVVETNGGRLTGEELIRYQATTILDTIFANPIIGDILRRGGLLKPEQLRKAAGAWGNFERVNALVKKNKAARFTTDDLIDVIVLHPSFRHDRKRIAEVCKETITRRQNEYWVETVLNTFLEIMVGTHPSRIALPAMHQKSADLDAFREHMENLGEISQAFASGRIKASQIQSFLRRNGGKLRDISVQHIMHRLPRRGDGSISITDLVEYLFASHTRRPVTPDVQAFIQTTVEQTQTLLAAQLVNLAQQAHDMAQEAKQRVSNWTHMP